MASSRRSGLEVRTTGAAQVDAINDSVIKGYPIVFNTLSADLGGFKERILPEAVDRSLKADVRALVDHDTAKIIGRTRSGTMSMRKDKNGLRVQIEPDLDISYARDIVRAVARGDVSGMSFGFVVLEDEWHKEDGEPVREILDMELHEVSVVTFPAYLETDVEVARRSLAHFKESAGETYNWRRLYHEISNSVYD